MVTLNSIAEGNNTSLFGEYVSNDILGGGMPGTVLASTVVFIGGLGLN